MLAVGPDSFDMESDILPVFLEDLPQIHGQGLKHHAQVLLVKEVSEESYAVVAIFRIGVVQFFQNIKFLESRLVPAINRRAPKTFNQQNTGRNIDLRASQCLILIREKGKI